MRRIQVCVLAVSIAALCALGTSLRAQNDARARFDSLVEEEWQYRLNEFPELATQAQDYRNADRLSDRSEQAYLRRAEHARQMLKRFDAVHAEELTAEQSVTCALLRQNLRDTADDARWKSWEMPLNQFDGFHLGMIELASDSHLETPHDYQQYAARLQAIPRMFEQEIAEMRAGMAHHLMPPRFLLEKAAQQVQSITAYAPEASPFWTLASHFGPKVSAQQQQELKANILHVIEADVQPAYQRLYKFLTSEYVAAGRQDPGIWALPDGEARYRTAVREMTTTDLTPERIHQLGLSLVTEIEGEMQAVARGQGYKDLESFNQHIRGDRALYAKSGEQLLQLYQHYTDQMRQRLPELFADLPRNKLVVIPMESSRAPDAVPADYSIGAGEDGTRPGRINVNLYAPEHRLLLNVEAIAYHEGIPGHHLQFTLAQQASLPPIRKFDLYYNAFSEGWAFYAERLGKELGFYQDPYSEYGRLENEMWRAVRLVVDTGVHYKHWTRDQMVEFFRKHTAMDEPNIQTEVDRYIAWPAQALSYKIGQMKILELREKYKREMGQRFDIRQFHRAVLAHGPLPLNVLEQQVQNWSASVQAH